MQGYFEDKDKDKNKIIKEQQAQIIELNNKKDKAVKIIYRLGREYGIPQNYVDVSSTAIQKAESGVTLVNSLVTVASVEYWDYSETKIKMADILGEFVDAKIMGRTTTCPNCGCVNDIDLNSPFVICKKCSNQIL